MERLGVSLDVQIQFLSII